MKVICDWCGKETDTLEEVEVIGGVAKICKKCLEKHNEGVCITCGEPIYSSISANGECLACMQIRSAAAEKRKSEALNGMGPEFLERITESANFTTEDYFTWMAGDGKWASEKSRDAFRLGWMEEKLVRHGKWTEDEFTQNYPDIKCIMDNNSAAVFREVTRFVLVTKDKRLPSGAVVLTRHNNVALIKVEG